MQTQRPKISFTFPYRWLEDPEDRKYLTKNLQNEARRSGLYQIMHPSLPNPLASSYIIYLKYHAYQPVKINLTKKEIEKIFKPMFGGAQCLAFETFFVQKPTPEGLPVMELEVYY